MLLLSTDRTVRAFPVMNILLIAANVAVWVLYALPDLGGAVTHAAFYPCDVVGTCQKPGGGPLSWFTAMFFHASWKHLLGNMLYLAIFGGSVEAALGHRRYLAMYVGGGFAAAVLQAGITLLSGSGAEAQIPMLGASGAVSAVLGAFLALYPQARIKTLLLVFVVKVPAWLYLGSWFAYQLVNARYVLTTPDGGGGGVAFFAHIGGFVLGWFVARRLLDRQQVPSRPVRWGVEPAPADPGASQ